jgi:hypothetical protein
MGGVASPGEREHERLERVDDGADEQGQALRGGKQPPSANMGLICGGLRWPRDEAAPGDSFQVQRSRKLPTDPERVMAEGGQSVRLCCSRRAASHCGLSIASGAVSRGRVPDGRLDLWGGQANQVRLNALLDEHESSPGQAHALMLLILVVPSRGEARSSSRKATSNPAPMVFDDDSRHRR